MSNFTAQQAQAIHYKHTICETQMEENLGVTKRSQLTHPAKTKVSTESTTLVMSTTVELIFLRPRREVDEYELSDEYGLSDEYCSS